MLNDTQLTINLDSNETRALLRLERTLNLFGGREGGREGGMTVIHIQIGMFNSNPMIPPYLNNNLT